MGINISSIISKEEIKFEDLADKRIVIDFSNMAYQFVSSIRQRDGTPLMDSQGRITSHLQGILSRVTNLMSKKIKPIFVFDGKPPLLKLQEQEARAHRKQIAEAKLKEAMEEDNINDMYKYSKQTTRLSKTMFEESKQLLEALGLPVIQAPSEAEMQAAYIVKQNDAWAVASSDFDCLLFGAPRMIKNLTLSQQRRLPGGRIVYTFLEYMELDKILKELDLTQDQLIHLGILVGTDFNMGGIKGIGPKKALKLLKENKNMDKVYKNLKVDFDWKEIYNIFHKLDIKKDYKLDFKSINHDKIHKILIEEHDFSEDRVNNILKKVEKKPKNQKGLSDYF